MSHAHESDVQSPFQVKQKKQEQEDLFQVIEKSNIQMSQLQTEYEEQVCEVRRLSEELQEKEEECETLHKLQNIKHKEITKIKEKFNGIVKKKEVEIEQLKKELVKKKQVLSEYSDKIQNLQQQLDRKTAEYELVSSRVTELEREKDDQENKFKLKQTEYEQELQREAARTLGATEHAKEVEVSVWMSFISNVLFTETFLYSHAIASVRECQE